MLTENNVSLLSDDVSVDWKDIPVPGCWETFGLCEPKYDYPDSLTGYYKTTFEIPEEWKDNRVFIKFDGVLYGYDLYINNQYVNNWESGYNTRIFDITQYIDNKIPIQQLSMRVYSKFKGSDFDCNDDWAPNGIYRDVTLFTTPQVFLKDITIRTEELQEGFADVKIDYELSEQNSSTEVTVKIESPLGDIVNIINKPSIVRIDNPHTWTAEIPNLYKAIVELKENNNITTYKQAFGIRKITIDGNVFKLNGKPIKLKGVNCHATDPRTIKVIGDSLTLKDMKLMKEASVNCIRTSHYPREPRFYELADSLGFYVIDEIPFGYGENLLNDESVLPVLLSRAESTIMRDKNHPCVIIWSIGNENDLTPTCEEVGKYVKETEPSRPICYPQMGSYFKQQNYTCPDFVDTYAPHYPTLEELNTVFQNTDRPIIFTEYLHTLGQSFEDHDSQWKVISESPNMAGGCVWEWVDQGVKVKTPHLESLYGYREIVHFDDEHAYSMNGNKGTDGLLYANRVPLSNYFELQHNYASAAIEDTIIQLSYGTQEFSVKIKNTYDFIELKDSHSIKWYLVSGNDTIENGVIVPDCSPKSESTISISLNSPLEKRKDVNYICFEVYNNDYLINTQTVKIVFDELTLKDLLLEKIDKRTTNPFDNIQEWPLVRMGRKQTLSDKTKMYRYLVPKYLTRVNGSVASNEKVSVDIDLSISQVGNVYKVDFILNPEEKEVNLSELGVGMLLPNDIESIQWIGKGPYPSYPGKEKANQYGIWGLNKEDLYFEGNRKDVEVVLLLDRQENGYLFFSKSGSYNFEQTDEGLVLSYNVAVAGISPKYQYTTHPVWAYNVNDLKGEFYVYFIKNDDTPAIVKELFKKNKDITTPYKPFLAQYDTYLMEYENITYGEHMSTNIHNSIPIQQSSRDLYRLDGVKIVKHGGVNQIVIEKGRKKVVKY